MTSVRPVSRPIVGLFATVLLLAAASALAFQMPDNFNDRYEVRLPMVDQQAAPQFAGIAASNSVEAALQSRYGGNWKVYRWNAHTGTPGWIYGSAVSKSAGIGSEAQLEQAAKMVLAENADILRADLDNLALVHAPKAGDKWAAHFQQTWNGYEVHEGLVRMVFHENGNLMVMGSDLHPYIELDPSPVLSRDAAADAARLDLPYQAGRGDNYTVNDELIVLPIRTTESTVQYHLVYRVTVRTAEPLGSWVTHVDAHTGDVVWRYNNIHFDHIGSSSSSVQEHTLCNGQSTLPAYHMNMSVGGSAVTTDADGNWSVPGGTGSASVSATLQGPYVRVFNQNGAEAQYSGTASEDVPLDVAWNDFNSRQDERDVFEAINRIHEFFQLFDPDFSYINTPINAYVNRNDGYCPGNAWWDGTINFCAAGGSYNNTGELQQVVEHEFGHGIQNAILGGTQGNEGLGEGNSDMMGMLLTQESIIGRGFYVDNCVSGIRNADNNLQYPADLNGSVHHDGQIIGGFHWDAMQLLQATHGEDEGTLIAARTWHEGRVLLRPMYQDDQVWATFVADDDNGDLDDGTPNHAIFAEAAENHSFVYPEILVGMFVYHDGVAYQTASAGGVQVRCTGASLGGGEVDASSFVVSYAVDGGAYNDVSMTDVGDEFMGVIPSQAPGAVVRYQITARNTLGDVGTSPRNAPESLHYFETGNSFSDEMELDTAWRAGIDGDTAGTGMWERGTPSGTDYNGTPVQLGSDHTPAPGVACWVTGAAGSTAGDNDVDGGKTTLLSPVFDLNGGMDIQISYWRYYTNAVGNDPNNDDWIVDISNDGGETWSSVENTTNSDTAWQQVTIQLADFFSDPALVQLRFVADDAGDGSLVEAMVDDFTLVGTFMDPTGVDDELPQLVLSFDLAQNHPNPFNPQTQVSFSLDRAGLATLQVFDTRGRLVRTLVSQDLPAGAHEVTWRGDDQRGRPVPSGVYFYRLQSGDQTASKRMLLVK